MKRLLDGALGAWKRDDEGDTYEECQRRCLYTIKLFMERKLAGKKQSYRDSFRKTVRDVIAYAQAPHRLCREEAKIYARFILTLVQEGEAKGKYSKWLDTYYDAPLAKVGETTSIGMHAHF